MSGLKSRPELIAIGGVMSETGKPESPTPRSRQ